MFGKKSLLALALIVLVSSLLLVGCENKAEEDLPPLSFSERGGYTVTKDLSGKELALVPKGSEIPEEVLAAFPATSIIRTPVTRVVVASGTFDPGIIFMLGKGETIIGSTDLPEEWALPEMRGLYDSGRIKFVGFFDAMDFEGILELKPDLIIASSITNVDDLNYLGLPVVVTYNDAQNDIESYYDLIVFIGTLYGEGERARGRVADIRAALDQIGERVKGEKRPKFTWGTYWDKRVLVLSSDYWLTQLMTLCGGEYAFSDVNYDSISFSQEEFITRSRDADVYFASYGHDAGPKTLDELVTRYPDLMELKAFAQKGVVAMAEPILWQDSGYPDRVALEVAGLFHSGLYPESVRKYIRIFAAGPAEAEGQDPAL
jgi:iron complex transport system substrate-binding protein